MHSWKLYLQFGLENSMNCCFLFVRHIVPDIRQHISQCLCQLHPITDIFGAIFILGKFAGFNRSIFDISTIGPATKHDTVDFTPLGFTNGDIVFSVSGPVLSVRTRDRRRINAIVIWSVFLLAKRAWLLPFLPLYFQVWTRMHKTPIKDITEDINCEPMFKIVSF